MTGAPAYAETIALGAFRQSGFDTGVVKVAVPMEYTPHGLIVPVEINGVLLRLTVDTGASRTVLFTAAAKRAGLKPGGMEPLRLPDSKIETARLGLGSTIRIGHAWTRNEPVLIIPPPPTAPARLDGALGIATLRDWDLRLDIPRREMTLFPVGQADALSGETYLRLFLSPPKDKKYAETQSRPALVFIPLVVNRHTVMALLDTGYGGRLSIPSELAEKLEPGILARSTAVIVGSMTASGIMKEREAALTEVVFRNDVFHAYPVILEIIPRKSPLGGHGTVGLGLLRHYVMTFSFRRERLALKPAGTPGESASDPQSFRTESAPRSGPSNRSDLR